MKLYYTSILLSVSFLTTATTTTAFSISNSNTRKFAAASSLFAESSSTPYQDKRIDDEHDINYHKVPTVPSSMSKIVRNEKVMIDGEQDINYHPVETVPSSMSKIVRNEKVLIDGEESSSTPYQAKRIDDEHDVNYHKVPTVPNDSISIDRVAIVSRNRKTEGAPVLASAVKDSSSSAATAATATAAIGDDEDSSTPYQAKRIDDEHDVNYHKVPTVTSSMSKIKPVEPNPYYE